ncbi:flagellar biosynthetic protein FliO [Paenibacillus ginsengarvi]|uniref:Flagellar protein n=1 Tax=Paenibacillus ginsengarvi TaxID=400777 RepID=A0A3B0CNK7_9BACL|nr:flagellar biosynthetic protein FliO [Paenibacillus ginsengarvi]RKN86510.1 flagellar protein [Paenibacillus ginsengarvi]
MAMTAGGRLSPLRKRVEQAALAVCSLAVSWSIASTAYADGKTEEDSFRAGTGVSAVPGDSGAVFIAMVKVIFFLVLIIGIFLVIMKVLAKKKWRWHPAGAAFHTLGGLSLGQNKSVQVVEIGRSIYVLGVGENITLIQKIDDPEEMAYITAFLSPEDTIGGLGLQKLRDWLGRNKKSETESVEDENQVAASFQSVFQSKMNQMAGRKKMMEDMLQNGDNDNRKLEP